MRHYSTQKLLFFCALPFLLVSPCLLVPAQTASPALSAAQWQEDLRFLQKTVHEQFSFLFKKITAVAFDEQADEFHSNIPSMQSHEIKVGLSRIVSLFKYEHTQIPFDTVAGKVVLPVKLYHFEDGIFGLLSSEAGRSLCLSEHEPNVSIIDTREINSSTLWLNKSQL